MEVVGKLKLKTEIKTYGDNGFQKREFVITTDDQYPQMIQIELIQDKCALIDNFNVGDDIKVSINLGGREWINPQGEAKYFNSVQGWRIEKLQSAPNTPQQPLDEFKPTASVSDSDDTLPF